MERFILSNNGNLHCPVFETREEAERTFNYQVRMEHVATLDLPDGYVCEEKRCKSCDHCCLTRKD